METCRRNRGAFTNRSAASESPVPFVAIETGSLREDVESIRSRIPGQSIGSPPQM
jgi:hypothetical protein